MRWIVQLAVLVLLALVAVQLRERQAPMATAAEELGDERRGVIYAEGYVDDLDARIDEAADRMRELDEQLSAIEARHPHGIPAAEREDYGRLLTRRNEVVAEHNDLVSRRRTAVQEYTDRVGRHNEYVEDANALAGESAPWRIVRGLWERVVGPSAD